MKYKNDQYRHQKQSLSKLLRENDLVIMANDFAVLDRIFNLLSENKAIDKIPGIISRTVIVKYGGDIEEDKVERVYAAILNWWEGVEL